MYLLSTNRASDLTNLRIMAPGCYIYINDTADMNHSTITAGKILYSGAPPKEVGALFPEAMPALGPPVSDPCPTIPGCAFLMDHPPSTAKCGPGVNSGNVTLSPGCYNYLDLTGRDKLNPGLYVVNRQFHLNNATVVGSDVTIYLSANLSDTNFSGSHLTLSAPLSGNYNGALFYRPSGQSAGIDFSTCTCDLMGILYFPTATVDYNDTGGRYQLLIFGAANLSNDENLFFGPP